MQLESHATPPKESPQQRYATLHRAIERGLDSDEIWRELAEVSLRLGHSDEAVDCLTRIRGSVVQQVVRSRLERSGLLASASTPATAAADHSAAPAASHAGKRKEGTMPRLSATRLQDHVVDAVQYLFHQHMPLLVLLTTLAFPLVVGMGGFLTAGDSPFLLAAIAALPGMMVFAVVGAMGRQILVTSSQGIGDVPNVPEFGELVADARRFLGDAGIVLGSLLVPSLAALTFGAPIASAMPGLLIGAFFTPLAWALRQVRGDLGALSPTTLLRGVARCGVGYFGLVAVCWALFAPAATVGWIVFGRPVWVQIAMVGPLCVLPLFVASRLLGTWLDSKRVELATVLVRPAPTAATPAPVPPQAQPQAQPQPRPASAAARPSAPPPRLPKRPAHLEHFTPPNLKKTAAAPAAAAQPVRATTARAPAAKPAPKQATTAATAKAPTKPAQPRPATPKSAPAPTAPAKAPAAPAARSAEPKAIEGRSPRRALSDQPDLSSLPGAVVVTGRERARHGAAARPR